MDFHDAWHFLCSHPYYHHPKFGEHISAFPSSLYTMVVKVNPDSNMIEDDDSLNTETRVWIESGEWVDTQDENDIMVSHDFELDTGGDTFEEAIISLAEIVKELYGSYS